MESRRKFLRRSQLAMSGHGPGAAAEYEWNDLAGLRDISTALGNSCLVSVGGRRVARWLVGTLGGHNISEPRHIRHDSVWPSRENSRDCLAICRCGGGLPGGESERGCGRMAWDRTKAQPCASEQEAENAKPSGPS